MEKEVVKNHQNSSTNSRERQNNNHNIASGTGGAGDSSRSQSDALKPPQSDLLLQWGNRKRLRCMKIQVKDIPCSKTTVRVDRRVVRSGDSNNNTNNNNHHQTNNGGHFNLRQRPASPAHPPAHTTQRVLRNSESAIGMKGLNNGGARGVTSPDRAQDNNHKRGGANYNNHHNGGHESNGNGRNGSSSEPAQEISKKGGSSSGSDGIPTVWPPKFVIALTNKEKEDDFMAIKGSRLPQRPKKRAKFIQRTLNLVSPGGWLCDLTSERYEVREKKVSKKRPRGLKAMGNMDSDSE